MFRRFLIPLVWAIVSLALPQTVRPRNPHGPGAYRESLAWGGVWRAYDLRIPRGPGQTRPLVVLLHGWISSADQILGATGFDSKAEREGFVLVAPDGLGKPQGWNAGFLDLTGAHHPDDVGFIGRLIDQVESETPIDPNRIYVVGHSNGGMMAHLAGSLLGARLAGIGVVAGTIGLKADGRRMQTIPEPATPISVIIVHGQKDGMVAYDRGSPALLSGVSAPESARWWAVRDGCRPVPSETRSPNGNVRFDLYSGGRNGTEVELVSIRNGVHDWPGGYSPEGHERATGVNATDLIWSFFVQHPRRPGG